MISKIVNYGQLSVGKPFNNYTNLFVIALISDTWQLNNYTAVVNRSITFITQFPVVSRAGS